MTTQSRVETAVTDPVHFSLSVVTNFEGDHWVAHSIENSIFTYGESEEEALELNAEANRLTVAHLKTQGRTLLAEYFAKHAIDYVLGAAQPGAPKLSTARLTKVTCAA